MRRFLCYIRDHRLGLWFAAELHDGMLWGHIDCYRCERRWFGPAHDRFREQRGKVAWR